MQAVRRRLERGYLHYGGAIVCDRLSAIFVYHEQITAIWTKCALDCRLHCETGIDVRNDLTSALGLICAYGR